jgi:heme exporter protein D
MLVEVWISYTVKMLPYALKQYPVTVKKRTIILQAVGKSKTKLSFLIAFRKGH